MHKALVIPEAGFEGAGRYRMLETVRQYARGRLTDSGDEETVRRGHLRFFLTFAETASHAMNGADTEDWLRRLASEHDNLRTALDWALGRDTESSLWLVGALRSFWVARGHLRDAAERAELALERGGADGSDLAHALALQTAATIALLRGDLPRTAAYARQCLARARPLGATSMVAFSSSAGCSPASARRSFAPAS